MSFLKLFKKNNKKEFFARYGDKDHIEKLKKDKDVSSVIPENMSLSENDLEKYVNHSDPIIRRAAANNPSLNHVQVSKLVNDDDKLVRQNMSYRKNLTDSNINDLISKSRSDSCLSFIARRKDLNSDHIEKLKDLSGPDTKISLIIGNHYKKDELEKLAKSNHMFVSGHAKDKLSKSNER